MTHASRAERIAVWTFAALLCIAVWASVIAAVWTVARNVMGEL